MIGATFLSHIVEFNYILLGNILGYSLLATLPMIYLFWFTTKKYCWFTKLSVLALPIMNLVCITSIYMDYYEFSYIYDLIIIAIITILSIIFTIQKK